MAAEHGTFAAARFLGLENTVRELQLAVGDLGNSVRLLTETQQNLSEAVKGRIDEISNTVLVFGENLSSHAQLLETQGDRLTKFRQGCQTLEHNADRVEQLAEIKGDLRELGSQIPTALTTIHDATNSCKDDIRHVIDHARVEFRTIQQRVEELQG